jgi:peroxiredoxin
MNLPSARRWAFIAVFLTTAALFAPFARSAEKPEAPEIAPGHSLHGEAYDEGPRQSAVLMPGTGKVEIKISSKHPKAQAFFNQGLGQLHGFWYFEAERSFRQVAFYDTNCAMAYWGMAMANVNNTKRAVDFIKQADDLKTKASPREVMWIEAYHKYFAGSEKETERRKQLILALERIIQKHPRELEAKTFLVFQLWENESNEIPLSSRMAVDSLAQEVLAKEPLHPIHHARIHLWNSKADKLALNSAAMCGQSAPAIAHMWHMPGHTYSQLKRYDDAAWQQEASARTDHAYMMATRILPDQIFNFAHNNQWLCTDLLYCGRVQDEIDLARNMVELPRHPKYNTLNRKEDNTSYDKNNGSSMLGRNRLFDAFLEYELWDQMLELADTMYLEPTDLPEEQAHRFYALALAHFALGHTNEAQKMISSIADCSEQLHRERFDAAEKAEQAATKEKKDTSDPMVKAMKGFNDRVDRVKKYRDELQIWSLLSQEKTNDARELLRDANGLPPAQRARLWLAAGDSTNCLKAARELVSNSTNQAPELALAAYLDLQANDKTAARGAFEQLRAISADFDLTTPIFARLAPIANDLGFNADWRVERKQKKDVGKRPPLDSLGPFRWSPYAAPDWKFADAGNNEVSLSECKGRPVLLVFYLGGGCAHCIEQLTLLADKSKDFEERGIRIVAVSSDRAGLRSTATAKGRDTFPFPLVSDQSLKTFKAYRAYDDFEKMPLHATFLIDGGGKVRWQDISYEPFTDVTFLLAESRRLLAFGQH